MRAIKRVLNVKIFFFFKKGLFFFSSFFKQPFLCAVFKAVRRGDPAKATQCSRSRCAPCWKMSLRGAKWCPHPHRSPLSQDSATAWGQQGHSCPYLCALISGQGGIFLAHTVVSAGRDCCLACCLLPAPCS